MKAEEGWTSFRPGPNPGAGSFRRPGDGTQPAGGFLAEPQVSAAFLLSVPDYVRGMRMKKKIDIAKLPELPTSVGLHGSLKQKEVGGPVCLGVAIAIMYAL